ncbi:MAG TPA: hypothetical protein PKD27_07365 [Tepidiformaceae bacterium]|nr:hypothetical protein [Tepidiformaceae bacterium]
MIVERLSFRAKYGRGDELVALLKSAPGANTGGFAVRRIYTDHTGPMFTVQAEVESPGLRAYTETTLSETAEYGSAEFQQWFARMVECTESGERQLLNLTVP